jgi:DNA excision repair protein ERCC-2
MVLNFSKPDSEDLDYQDFFPYPEFRPDQEKVIQQINQAAASQKNTILIAANGTGKTIMALSAILPVALKLKKKIIFCSRTFTQNARVIEETKEITKSLAKKKIEQMIGAISLRGRNEMCVNKTIELMKRKSSVSPHELMSICGSLRKNKQCKYFNAILKRRKALDKEISALAKVPMDAMDLMEYSEQYGMCPYFLIKFLMEKEDIVVCNYQWIFEPNIRETFLENLGCSLADCIVVMDECHNLPEMATGINSYKLSPYILRLILRDLESTRATRDLINFIKNLNNMIQDVKEQVVEETKLNPQKFLSQVLSINKFASTQELTTMLLDLEEYGKALMDEKSNEGKIPRDYIGPVVQFFEMFTENLDSPAFFPCMTVKQTSKGKSVAIELKCLDSRFITDPIFKEAFATLSLSGTLHPYTYLHLLGLNNTGKMLKIIKMRPPFPQKNARVILVKNLNTKGKFRTSVMYREYLIALKPIIENTPKNVGVFCASYEVLEGLWANGFEKLVKSCKKKCYRESMGSSSNDNDIIIEQFKDKSNSNLYEGGVLLGVCGGRNSEGEDFPGDYMNAVAVVGVPFQRPTPSVTAKIDYYEQLFPKQGRLFGYIIPALQRSNQACGRPIRRMKDQGLIALMDYRFKTYMEYLSDWVQKSIHYIPDNQAVIFNEVTSFFKKTQ